MWAISKSPYQGSSSSSLHAAAEAPSCDQENQGLLHAASRRSQASTCHLLTWMTRHGCSDPIVLLQDWLGYMVWRLHCYNRSATNPTVVDSDSLTKVRESGPSLKGEISRPTLKTIENWSANRFAHYQQLHSSSPLSALLLLTLRAHLHHSRNYCSFTCCS